MAEHIVCPTTTDAVGDGSGSFQKPDCWQLVAVDVYGLDQMAQGAYEHTLVVTYCGELLVTYPYEVIANVHLAMTDERGDVG